MICKRCLVAGLLSEFMRIKSRPWLVVNWFDLFYMGRAIYTRVPYDLFRSMTLGWIVAGPGLARR